MAKCSRKVGTTSLIVEIAILDTTSTTGAGKTGIAYNASGLSAYYKRNTASASVAITLASVSTLGTFVSGGLKEVDSTNMPGTYELHIPNAALVTGADSVVIQLFGAASMAPVWLEIELTQTDNQDGTRGGMTNLPNSPMAVKKNAALNAFSFPMFDTSGSPRTGLTVTAQRALDGGSFASCANSVTEMSNGWYKIDLANTDLNGVVVALRFSATGCQDTDFTLVTQA